MIAGGKARWQQAAALISLGAGGAITGFQFVPGVTVDPAAPPITQIRLLALRQAAQAQPAGTQDAKLRSAIVNVATYYLRLAATRSPAEMEALIWQRDSLDEADHGQSCAAFASLTLELAAQVVGQQSWVTGGDSYPWPLHDWADVRVDPNPGSLQIVSILQDAQAHGRWHPLGDGYQPEPGDWVMFDNHVEVVTSYARGVLDTIGGDSLPNFSVNAHQFSGSLADDGVAGFVDNGHLASAPEPAAASPAPGSAAAGSAAPGSAAPGSAAPGSAAAGSPGAGSPAAASPPAAGQAAIPGQPPGLAGPKPGGSAAPSGKTAAPNATPAAGASASPAAAPSASDADVPGLAAQAPAGTTVPAAAPKAAASASPAPARPSAQAAVPGLAPPAPGEPQASAGPAASPGPAAAPAASAAVPGLSAGASSAPAASPSATIPGLPSTARATGAAPASPGGTGPAAPAAAPYGRSQSAAPAVTVPETPAQQAFIASVVPGAVAAQRRYGVPAAVTIAQAIDESGWGQSVLAVKDHNLFGIKGIGPAGSDYQPTQEYVNGQPVSTTAGFRVYRNVAESIDDHGRLLATSGYYSKAMSYRSNPNAFAASLTGVYATDPDYGAKIISLMSQYDLYRYDAMAPTGPAANAASQAAPAAGPAARASAGTGAGTSAGAGGGSAIPGLPSTGASVPGLGAAPSSAPGPAASPSPAASPAPGASTPAATPPAPSASPGTAPPGTGPPGTAAPSSPAPSAPASAPASAASPAPATTAARGDRMPDALTVQTTALRRMPGQAARSPARSRADIRSEGTAAMLAAAAIGRPRRAAGARSRGGAYRHQMPVSVTTAFLTTAQLPLMREAPLYRDVAGQAGIRWELLAACDWMQCKARPRYSPVHGERLGTVNGDGRVYRTRSEALEQCADDLAELAWAVYRIDLTAPGGLSVLDLANVFAAFRWGGLLRLHHTSAMEFPYSVAGLTEHHLSMRWPGIDEPNTPDKPGTRFRMPFGAVPVVLSLDYPATA
jgi:flagellum-specific peptidoglycan hydrolase FlgJ